MNRIPTTRTTARTTARATARNPILRIAFVLVALITSASCV